tara:strand:- start:563 stop:856 length:294 start_codon:yes stop_codon:yes gene_type:complete
MAAKVTIINEQIDDETLRRQWIKLGIAKQIELLEISLYEAVVEDVNSLGPEDALGIHFQSEEEGRMFDSYMYRIAKAVAEELISRVKEHDSDDWFED